jgi:hypothetical protein
MGPHVAEQNQLKRLDLKSNRFQGSKELYNMVEGAGRRQSNISKRMAGATGLVGKTNKKKIMEKTRRVEEEEKKGE